MSIRYALNNNGLARKINGSVIGRRFEGSEFAKLTDAVTGAYFGLAKKEPRPLFLFNLAVSPILVPTLIVGSYASIKVCKLFLSAEKYREIIGANFL